MFGIVHHISNLRFDGLKDVTEIPEAVSIERLQLRHENTWQSTSVWQKSIVLNGNWREVGV